jgi:NAD(P)-dependent dehydrogenase (short-subunit alcohol dehydrogenase family)
LKLVSRGAHVVVADIDADGGNETVELTRGRPGTAMFQRCDVTSVAEVSTALATAAELGELAVVHNNAGIGDDDLFGDRESNFANVVELDLTAVIRATRLAVLQMRRRGHGGVIVNTASLIGLEPVPFAPVYAAAKAGVVAFTRALAFLADESAIRVNAICPEIVDTPMVRRALGARVGDMARQGQILTADEVADAVLRLVDDDTRAGAVLKITVAGGEEFVER